MSAPETYTLDQVTGFLRRVLALNFPEPLWLAAELAQANESRGHYWLTLVQKDEATDDIVAQLEAVLWRNQLDGLRRIYGLKTVRDLLQRGMSVRLRTTMSFHERFGMRLVVEDIDPAHTIGALELRRQRTLETLAAAGLLDRNAARPLPPVPQRLAVISSTTAAGLADFRDQLAANPYGYAFDLRLFPAAMQGARTSPEVLRRLREIERQGPDRFAAVVIVRGGGGRTELAAFDEEALCRAVADFPLPVLCGIGHETDESVLDRVAHTSLKTPTAVAAFLVERLAAAEGRALAAGRRVAAEAAAATARAGRRLDGRLAALTAAGRMTLATETARLDTLAAELRRRPAEQLRAAAERLTHHEQLLTALRPSTTLGRGYALVEQEGKLITAPEELRPGTVTLRLRDGTAVLLREG